MFLQSKQILTPGVFFQERREREMLVPFYDSLFINKMLQN
jgi:hypothetical protein